MLFGWKILILLLRLGSNQTCQATVFGMPGDRLGSEPILLTGRPVSPRDMGIAHRTLPIGSTVVVCAQECAAGVVLDRGPYGATDEHGNWVNAAPRFAAQNAGRNLKYRGCADLTPAMARAVGHNGGRQRVTIWFSRKSR